MTNIPGSSAYFLGGVVAYSNELKTIFLDVPADLLQEHGAVSREVAEAMAAGVRNRTGAEIGLAVTGIAGPDGGSPEKPVGTVFIGIATAEGNWASRFQFSGDRQQIREIAAQSGLDLVRKYLLQMTGR
jgi:nicotinamide-nucleotide amidase